MIAQLEANKTYSLDEYLEFEVNSDERHEYLNGEIILMTGGTPNHNQLAGNFYSALNFGLKRQPYRVFITDQRIWIPDQQIYTYPDVVVVPQPLNYQENRRDTLINPLMIAEVLSKSTKGYDKDEKFAAYRTIPTFQEYLLIDQYSMHVEHYAKIDINQWLFKEYNTAEIMIALASIPFQIEVGDLYDKVDFAGETQQ